MKGIYCHNKIKITSGNKTFLMLFFLQIRKSSTVGKVK